MCVQWCCRLCVDIHVCPVVLWTMCRYTCVSSGAVDNPGIIHRCPKFKVVAHFGIRIRLGLRRIGLRLELGLGLV